MRNWRLVAVIGLACGTALPAGAGTSTLPASLAECGACHMVYPPQFMAMRSWAALLDKLDAHFGEIATLPPDKLSEISTYLTDNSADGPANALSSGRFLSGVPTDATPLRITDMPWWIGAHEEVSFAGISNTRIKSASNCLGCHGGGAKASKEPE